MAQFVNKLRDCMRTVNLTMLLVLNLFFIVTLNRCDGAGGIGG